MKALIFAAGLGTRLKPFTDFHPKALAPVGGIPMLQRVITKLRDAGVTTFVVNVHHFSDQIIEFLKKNDCFGTEILISDESGLLLDTGGGVLNAHHLLGDSEPVILHNADILTDFPMSEMIEKHLSTGADVTLLTDSRTTSRYLCFDSDNRMKGWINVNTNQTLPSGFSVGGDIRLLAFGGVHIISPAIFPLLEKFSNELKFSIIPFYADSCNRLDIRCFIPAESYFWHDIGNPKSLEEAEQAVYRK